jgi:hypothetical protein
MLFFWIEDNNMRIIFNAIVLSAASHCASIVFAENHARVDVPFSFVAKNSSFPAGPYDIMMDSSQSFITLASRTTSPKIIQMTLGSRQSSEGSCRSEVLRGWPRSFAREHSNGGEVHLQLHSSK